MRVSDIVPTQGIATEQELPEEVHLAIEKPYFPINTDINFLVVRAHEMASKGRLIDLIYNYHRSLHFQGTITYYANLTRAKIQTALSGINSNQAMIHKAEYETELKA